MLSVNLNSRLNTKLVLAPLFLLFALVMFHSSSFAGCSEGIKVDQDGLYCPFPGVTVLSEIGNENELFWKKIYSAIRKNKKLQKYYSPLPLSSYHMTTMNLYIKRDKGDDWIEFVSNSIPYFKKLSGQLQEKEFNPVIKPYEVRVSNSIIKIVVTLKPKDVDRIERLARKFGELEKVPTPFHVTLAYAYKPDIPEAIKAQIQEELNGILAQFEQETIRLDEPKLYYFFNMLEFFPWNGKFNPFVVSSKKKDLSMLTPLRSRL